MKNIKNILLYLIIALSCMILMLYLCISTNLGSKLILLNLHKFYNYKYSNSNYKIYVDFNQLQGNLLKQIVIKDFKLINKPLKLNLHIEQINLQINLLKCCLRKIIAFKIENLIGNINKIPLKAKLDLKFTNNLLQLNNQNFIYVGNNSLILSSNLNSPDLNLLINLKELNIFHPLLSGKIEILGKISKKLDHLSAKIIPENLNFDKFDLHKLINRENINLNLTADLIDCNPKVNFNLNLKDLSGIMQLVPGISRLKGTLSGSIGLDFKDNFPIINTNLLLDQVSITLPAYGIKIKPLTVNIVNSNNNILKVTGNGSMRNGPGDFFIKGKFDPFNFDHTNTWELTGKQVEFINNHEYHLIGEFDLGLKLSLLDQMIYVTGDTVITEGTINLLNQNNKITKSKDIILINTLVNNLPISKKYFKILPDINLRIEEKTRLVNNHLDANISGKIKVYALIDHDNTILGNGRITIKHGIYNLSGQKFIIDKGRIIYLPGTLIGNPMLDIKIVPNEINFKNHNQENYLYIEGTLDKPIIKDSGLINQQQVILHILNLGNNNLTSDIKKQLNLKELDIQENDDIISSSYTDDKQSLLDNKNFVIGKELLPNLHLKYIKPLNTSNNKIKLKTKLNNFLAIEIESSTEDGYGADLKFFKEIK